MRVGRYSNRVTLQSAGAAVLDTDGGYTQTPVVLVRRVPAAVQPASARSLERITANTVTSIASHLVTMRFYPGVTTEHQVIFHDGDTDRTMSISGIHDTDEQHVELVLECLERV